MTNFFLLLTVLVAVVAFAPLATLAKDFIVGDESGWTTNFDYQSWAYGKDFRVGDRLIFKYKMGVHNVYKANGTEFQNCEVPSAASRGLAMTSGNDIVVLATPGRKWYICGKPYHCSSKNQKLVIFVKPNSNSWAPSPSPLPSLAVGKDFIVGDSYGWTTNFDYQSWAKGKNFFVGDRLIFKYPMGVHNVYKANGTEFQNCEVPSAASRGLAMTSGNDTVVLATPGRKWYICGKPNHCSYYMQKLVIDVKPKPQSWAPSPSPYY
ncbi:Blue copper protein [Linum perenne]